MLFGFRAGARRTAVLALGALVTLGPGLTPASQLGKNQADPTVPGYPRRRGGPARAGCAGRDLMALRIVHHL